MNNWQPVVIFMSSTCAANSLWLLWPTATAIPGKPYLSAEVTPRHVFAVKVELKPIKIHIFASGSQSGSTQS